MLKRIHVQQLSLGMYLHELCGSWMEHPFWRTRFLLEDPQDLLRIRETSIQEVLIDISKGLDLANAATAQAEGEVSEAPQASPVQASPVQASPVQAEPVQAEPPSAATPMAQELQRAASICANAKQAVISMFSEARMGRAVDASSAPGLVSEIADSVTRNPSALISLARIKTADEYTFMHSVAVCALMVGLARQMGYAISNVDVTLICERPKVGPHAGAMMQMLAGIIGIAADRVSVKATTSERLGFTGREEGIAAIATATLVKA